jgi:RNA polymerase sigma-70 factor (ECF subfamily)
MARDLPEGAARAELARLLAIGRAAWPEVAIDPDDLFAGREALAEGRGSLEEVAAEADPANAGDLFLAFACAARHAVALAEFDRHFLRGALAHAWQLDRSPAFADELAQRVREKLFLGEAESRPRIEAYRGRGPLAAWLRVVVIRAGRDLLRSKRRSEKHGARERAGLRSVGLDPELGYLRERYGRELSDAFARTIERLSAKEKSVLSLYYLEGMSSAAIGALYGVTGAAVRLWIKDCREAMLVETHRILRERLGTDAAELESVLRVVGSQIDVSIRRLLRAP